jgi:hypothetical protein
MAEYQARKWNAWHHHIGLTMVALMFLAKERLAHRETTRLLSCQDLVQIMCHHLPSKIANDESLIASIVDRHRRRKAAMDSAYARQRLELPPELGCA